MVRHPILFLGFQVFSGPYPVVMPEDGTEMGNIGISYGTCYIGNAFLIPVEQ